MQYEVYLDVLFLENMMMDFLILLAVKKVFPCSATYGSLLAGSFTGSLLTCAILFFPCPVWTRYILLFFLVNSCMTVIGLKIRTFPVFFKAWILLYLASFLLGGIMSWLRLYFGKFFRIISFLFTLGICGFFLLYHGLLFLKKLWKSQDHSFDVILTVNGKDFHLKAFLDSGYQQRRLSEDFFPNLTWKTPVHPVPNYTEDDQYSSCFFCQEDENNRRI